MSSTSSSRADAGLPAKENHLFLALAGVRPGVGGGLPSDWSGAVISCYIAAPDHLAAAELAVGKINAEGYIFEDFVNEEIHEIDADCWNEHIAMVWPENPHPFPSQAEMRRFLRTGGVFFGPVCAWDPE